MAMPSTSTRYSRRDWLSWAAAGAAVLSLPRVAVAHGDSPHLQLWRNPDCGCCNLWVKHLENYQFTVQVHDVEDAAALRKKLGLPERFSGCHTAEVGGYVIEGHVPALDIKRLLRERPNALGLAVPGMPYGSPGMELGNKKDRYDVLLVNRDGSASIFKSYL